MAKGLMVFVYKNGADCTNDGVTSKVDKAVLIADDVPEIFDAREDMPPLFLSEFGGRLIAAPFPLKDRSLIEKNGNVRVMFGGNFIYTSDSRFPARNPIPVFDRIEVYAPYGFNTVMD